MLFQTLEKWIFCSSIHLWTTAKFQEKLPTIPPVSELLIRFSYSLGIFICHISCQNRVFFYKCVEVLLHTNYTQYTLVYHTYLLCIFARSDAESKLSLNSRKPWHFGTDPNPRIRTTDFRIRILLFSSTANKMPTKNKFFCSNFFYFLLFEGTYTWVFIEKWAKRSPKIVEIKDPYPDLEAQKTSGFTTLRKTILYFLW